MKLKDIRIGARLGIGFGILVVLMVGLVVTGLVATYQMKSRLDQIVNVNLTKIKATDNYRLGTRTSSLLTLGGVATKDEALREQSLKAAGDARKEYVSWLDKLEKIEDTAEGRKLLKTIKDNTTAGRTSSATMMELVKAGKNDEAVSGYLGKILTNLATTNDPVSKLTDFQHKDIERRYMEAQSTYNWSFLFLLVVGAVVVALAIALTFILTRSIVEPIRKSIAITQKLEAGKLGVDVRADRGDELGEQASALKGMVDKWRDIIGAIKQASDNVASTSTEMSAGAEQMARGADEQATRSHQVATASQEMSQTVLDISQNAASIASTAATASSTAKEGGRIVEESVEGSREIAHTVQESVDHITSLADLSHRIGEIIGIINEIADQTNLLALNAAIEAARAGEHGRGFAVVADEVRKLAERTTGATSEVSGIIKEIQNKVGGAVSSIQKVSDKVDRGVELSTKAGAELKNIVAGVDDLQTMVQQIATAIEEMSATSDQISKDIESISHISTDTSQSSAEVSKASRELSTLGVDLQRIAQQFEV